MTKTFKCADCEDHGMTCEFHGRSEVYFDSGAKQELCIPCTEQGKSGELTVCQKCEKG